MKDRVPTPGKEGRVRLRQDNGQILEGVLEMADEPLEIGTPLTKATLLQDATASILGLAGDPTVNDALLALPLVIRNMALVRVTVTVSGAPAISGIEITGIEALDGGNVYTDTNGEAVGFAPVGEVFISTQAYEDLPAEKTVAMVLSAGDIVDVDLAISSDPSPGNKTVTATTSNIRFSPYVSGVDVHCINGGYSGSGAYGSYSSDDGSISMRGGDGGRSGGQAYQLNIKPDTKRSYTATVGAGGVPAKGNTSFVNPNSGGPSNSGGVSSFMDVSPELESGEPGGAGSYYSSDDSGQKSGNSAPGASNTTHLYGETGGEVYGGSGGGGGHSTIGSESEGSPGENGGGTGGDADDNYNSVTDGADGTEFGSGGGGAAVCQDNVTFATSNSGAGYQGAVFYRWRVS